MRPTNAHSEWSRLDGMRRGFIGRCEEYANYTHPRLCRPNGYKQDTAESSHEWQAVGAQATNHVTNKLVMTLFNPARPFLRLDVTEQWRAKAAGMGNINDTQINAALAQGERKAVRVLDQRGDLRPKLYQVCQNLVVLGNVLLYLPIKKEQDVRVFGIKNYVVRRTRSGKVKTLIVKECLAFDELEQEVQDYYNKHRGSSFNSDSTVDFYQWIEMQADGSYTMTQWVNATRLPKAFDGKWPADKMPYRVLTWNLADEDDYGTGLVEDYAGDFAALSALSEAQVKGAILASEFRWLVNPAGMTSPEDLQNSENGAALPGLKDDVALVANSKPGDLQVVNSIHADYVRRIGYGFLLNSAVTRDAERVTAEEIRSQALELETSFGGTYSRIAVDLQKPLGLWLLKEIDIKISNTELEVTIITGLDALSRSAELTNLRGALADLANLANMPPAMLARLKLGDISTAVFNGWGVNGDSFVKTDDQVTQEQEQQMQQMNAQEAAAQGARAGADIAVARNTQGRK